MKKALVLALVILVISTGLLFAYQAKAKSAVFTLANLGGGATGSNTSEMSSRLAGSPATMTAGAGRGGAGVIEDPDWPFNTAIGSLTLSSNITGFENTASGYKALQNNISGEYNTAIGSVALQSNTTGSNNTAMGWRALLSNHNGGANTAIGFMALFRLDDGGDNTAIGAQALSHNTGWDNTALGSAAGMDCLNGNHNIFIGADVSGEPEDRNTTRIGSKYKLNSYGAWVGQNKTFISGIVENPISAGLNPAVVGITNDGQLGTFPSESLPLGPQGPAGPAGSKGPVGLQGPAGPGLISGSVLLLVSGIAPPPGYALLGTTEFKLGPPNNKSGRLEVNVYVKQ